MDLTRLEYQLLLLLSQPKSWKARALSSLKNLDSFQILVVLANTEEASGLHTLSGTCPASLQKSHSSETSSGTRPKAWREDYQDQKGGPSLMGERSVRWECTL